MGSDLISDQVVDWIRAHSAGEAVQYEGRWWMVMDVRNHFRASGGHDQTFRLVETAKPK